MQLSKKAIEFINGELLGDGGIYSYSKFSARFQYGVSKKEHAEFVRKRLSSFGIKTSKVKTTPMELNGKEYIGYNEKLQRHEVIYVFYGGCPKKWRQDVAYLTNEELEKIRHERPLTLKEED